MDNSYRPCAGHAGHFSCHLTSKSGSRHTLSAPAPLALFHVFRSLKQCYDLECMMSLWSDFNEYCKWWDVLQGFLSLCNISIFSHFMLKQRTPRKVRCQLCPLVAVLYIIHPCVSERHTNTRSSFQVFSKLFEVARSKVTLGALMPRQRLSSNNNLKKRN